MMKSMTGYAFREVSAGGANLSMELKSYNNRYLDLYLNLPPFLGPLEPQIRERLSSGIRRGRVEFSLKLKELEEDVTIRLDKAVASAYVKALESLIETTGLDEKLHLSHLLKMEGIVKLERNRGLEYYWNLSSPLLEDVMAEFEESRTREGKALTADIEEQLGITVESLAVVERHAPELERYIKENLKARFSEMLGQGADETRIYSETAVLLVKYSINEEIVRLRVHLDAFRRTVREEEGMGRKLDFICQEINREINTIGSKSFIIEINQAVIDMKDSLEKIREQLRNVE